MPVTFTTGIDQTKSVSSYSSSKASTASTVLSLGEIVNSYSSVLASSTARGGLSYEDRETTASYSSSIDSVTDATITLSVVPTSYSDNVGGFTYNERTSLELIDQTVDWDGDSVSWFTDWFQEVQILGSEDTLALRAIVVDGSKAPAATVYVQYDRDGDGTVDKESNPLRVTDAEAVQEIEGVPVNPDGHYRLRITDYSGYNSLTSIDTAIIH